MSGRTVMSVARSSARRAGFSVMELIVSIAILAILAGTLVPVMAKKLAASRDARRLSDVKTLVDAVEGYLLDKGTLPNGDAESGTGLGMRIVRSLAAQLGGELAVEVDGGTKVRLTFPVASKLSAVLAARGRTSHP